MAKRISKSSKTSGSSRSAIKKKDKKQDKQLEKKKDKKEKQKMDVKKDKMVKKDKKLSAKEKPDKKCDDDPHLEEYSRYDEEDKFEKKDKKYGKSDKRDWVRELPPKEKKKEKKEARKEKRQKMKKSARTMSAKAGLYLPVRKLHGQLKDVVPKHARVGILSTVYLTAVVEFVCSEILENATESVIKSGKSRITPRNLMLGIKGDPHLRNLFKGGFAQAGVVPQSELP